MDLIERIKSRAEERRRGVYLGKHLGKTLCFATHDQNIANDTGAAVRSDINSALAALFSNSSNATAPTTTIAYQWWADTASGLLKQRNAANSGWIVRGTLAETFVVSRSSNTILGVGDFGRSFVLSSTFTQTLTAAATLGDGWWCELRNDGTGIITLDPNGAETVDGAATEDLNPGQSCILICNGAAFKTVGLVPGRVAEIVFWPGLTLPPSAFDCDGIAYSRATYGALFAKLVKSATATMTIASPCVVTWTGHGLQNNMPVKFTTSGALPTGLLAGRTYWIINKATDTFQVALTPGAAAINTTGSQSGTHTAICAPHGDGDGSTTFNVPNIVDATPIGYGTATISEAVAAADVNTGTDSFAIQDNVAKWITGMAVVLTTSGGAPTGLTAGNTYFVVRNGTGGIKLASSLANAQNGTVIDITGQGTGTHTLTHTRTTRGLGEQGGESDHAQTITELLNHLHLQHGTGADTAGQGTGQASSEEDSNTSSTGGNAAMNVMGPFTAGRWIIYYQ